MPRSRQIMLRVEPEKHDKIKARAEETGQTVNNWINLVVDHYLATKGTTVSVTTTRKVTL